MHVPAAGHRPGRHHQRLIGTNGAYSNVSRFWPVGKVVKLRSGDHRRRSKTRARPQSPAARRPVTGSCT